MSPLSSILALVLLSNISCAGLAFSQRSHAFIYNNSKVPSQVTNNGVGELHGESCAKTILGLVTYGDASLTKAAASAGIEKISTVDEKNYSILGLYASQCFLVSGSAAAASSDAGENDQNISLTPWPPAKE